MNGYHDLIHNCSRDLATGPQPFYRASMYYYHLKSLNQLQILTGPPHKPLYILYISLYKPLHPSL